MHSRQYSYPVVLTTATVYYILPDPYNGGQKCWDLSIDITKTTKTSDPSPPSLFSATTLPGLVGEGEGGELDDGMNPKPNKKLSLGAESYGTIAWKGFFTKSQVLLPSIVTKWYATGKRFQNACARLIFKERKFSHITPLLQSYTGYQ